MKEIRNDHKEWKKEQEEYKVSFREMQKKWKSEQEEDKVSFKKILETQMKEKGNLARGT